MDQVVRLHYGVEAGQNSIHHQPHQAEEGLRVKRHQAVPKSSADAMFPCDSREGGSDADQPFPERLVESFVKAACQEVAAAEEVAGVCRGLARVRGFLLDGELPATGERRRDASSGGEVGHIGLLMAQAMDADGWREAVASGQAWAVCYRTVLDTLLTVVAPDWLAVMTRAQRQQLYAPFFERCPPPLLLAGLVPHLDAVQPELPPAVTGLAITEPSAAEAARQLAAHLMRPGAPGLREVLCYGSGDTGTAGAAAALSGPCLQPGPWLTRGGLIGAGWRGRGRLAREEVLAALVAAPDRCEALGLDELLSATQAVDAICGAVLAAAAPGGDPHALPLGVEVLQRLTQRGYVKRVAHNVYIAAATAADGAALEALLQYWTDSRSLEKLLLAVVRSISSAAGADMRSAKVVMQRLLTETACSRGDVRYIFADKLARGQVTLPGSMLPPLLSVLQERQDGALLRQAVVTAARHWASRDTVVSQPLPRQAFVAALVVEGIQRLGGCAGIEALPGLLPSLLDGVSARLESPVPAVRGQGMRVGRAMSMSLSPGGEVLFGDMGPLELVPEEFWEDQQRAPPLPPPPSCLPEAGQVDHATAEACPPQRGSHGRVFASDAPTVEDGAFEGVEEAGSISCTRSNARKGSGDGDGDDDNDPDAEVSISQYKEEMGWEPPERGAHQNHAGGAHQPGGSETSDSDDEDLPPYDFGAAEPSAAAFAGDTGHLPPPKPPTQLREAAASLRGAEKDMPKAVAALGALEGLVRAAPEELQAHAVELTQALLFVQLPEWVGDESMGGTAGQGEEARHRALVALLVHAPQPAGTTLARHLYSPHLDVSQRVMILNLMADAARELSGPEVEGCGGLEGRGRRGAAALPSSVAASAATRPLNRVGKTRVWGNVRLRQLREQQAGQTRRKTWRNRFNPVALEWMESILRGWNVPKHGVDLLGRDFLVLGHLLVTLGTFVEAAAPGSNATQGAAAMLELLQQTPLHAHQQPFVRRCALLAASQVLDALPPARLAASLSSGGADSDPMLGQLKWLHEWVEKTQLEDADEQCRMLAMACLMRQVKLAEGALLAGAAAGTATEASFAMQSFRGVGAQQDMTTRVIGLDGILSCMKHVRLA
eukprot:jgi/Tetstr1/440211/TSEL_028562.t1